MKREKDTLVIVTYKKERNQTKVGLKPKTGTLRVSPLSERNQTKVGLKRGAERAGEEEEG